MAPLVSGRGCVERRDECSARSGTLPKGARDEDDESKSAAYVTSVRGPESRRRGRRDARRESALFELCRTVVQLQLATSGCPHHLLVTYLANSDLRGSIKLQTYLAGQIP